MKWPLSIKFHSGSFLHTFVGRKATHAIQALLDPLGYKRLRWLVENNRDLVSVFPEDEVVKTAMNNPLPKEWLVEFPDTEVYGWIPPQYRAFFEELDGGKDWALKQIAFIRKIVVPS